jgi:outer membrane protein assembly factor BamE (lipoprotein component of BamABCDE complex)
LSRTSHDIKGATVSGPAAGRRSSAWRSSARHSPAWRSFALGAALLGAVAAGGCTQIQHHGYMAPEGALEQLPLGSTQEQVLIVLGTPSTVATISGEVFYYISQRSEQTSFLPAKETDRRVIAVYFDKSRRVQRLADYGLKDGKIFDYISRTTPSGGTEQNTLGLMFKIFKS